MSQAANNGPAVEARDGQVIGGWTLRRQLGKGGMGQVWKVFKDTPAGTAQLGVMKLPLSSGLDDDSTRRRAALEVKALLMLQGCSNIVQIIDLGVDRLVFYFVMEYVHGADLGEVIRALRRRREKLAPETAAWVAGEVGAGLKAIHNLVIAGVPQNLRHLDIALKNILVSAEGAVKIGDFGIASGSGDPDLTNRGSHKYMAPEHFFGVPSQKSDIYSLGVVLWELLERDHYRIGTDVDALRFEITSGKVRQLRRTDVSAQLAALVHDCLAPSETSRPTIDQFMVRLERVPEYRMQRATVSELIGGRFEGLRTSGHTEVFEALPATVTAELASLMAARKVLISNGVELELSQVFQGVTKPKAAPGYVSPSAGSDEPDGPTPPPLFAGVDAEDGVPVVPLLATHTQPSAALPMPASPSGARVPTEIVPPPPAFASLSPTPRARSARTVAFDDLPIDAADRTTRLPDGVAGMAMGSHPDDRSAAHDPRADLPAEPPVASTEHVEASGDARRGDSRRTALRLTLAMAVSIGLGAIAASAVVSWTDAGETPTTTGRSARGEPTDHPAAPAAAAKVETDDPRGPILRPAPTTDPEPEPAPAPNPAAGAAPGSTTPSSAEVVSVTITPDAPATPSTTSAEEATSPSIEPAPRPKTKPTPVVKVAVEVRNEWIKPGVQVQVGKQMVSTTGSVRLEVAAGRHRIRWREVGTSEWIDAGKFQLAPGKSHIVLVGKVSNPKGVRHVPQEIR